MAIFALFVGMLVIMLMRVALPLGARIPGQPVGRVTLSLGERVRLQRTNVYAIGGMLLVAALTGEIPFIVELIVVVAVAAIILIPTRYVLTSDGVALNRTVFRPWSDFTHVVAKPGRIMLVPRAGLRPFHLVVAPGKASALLPTIQQLGVPRRA